MTMVSAYRSAVAREFIAAAEKKLKRIAPYRGSASTPVLSPKNSMIPATGRDVSSATSAPIRRLSPSQVEEYRRKSLCFKCDEPYSQVINAKVKA